MAIVILLHAISGEDEDQSTDFRKEPVEPVSFSFFFADFKSGSPRMSQRRALPPRQHHLLRAQGRFALFSHGSPGQKTLKSGGLGDVDGRDRPS